MSPSGRSSGRCMGCEGGAGNVGHFLLRKLSVTARRLNQSLLLTLPLIAAVLAPGLAAQSKRTTYFPAAGTWQHKAPAEAGMDAPKVKEAVEWDGGPWLRIGTSRKIRCVSSANY